MPSSPRETVLCRYHYDPLNSLVECAPSAEADTQRFYCKSRLATEIQGLMQTSVFQHEDQLLGQQQSQSGRRDTTLLATDQQRSVLQALDATSSRSFAYTPYGHRPMNGLLSLLGFNGQQPDPVTGHYHLGNGYRAFNPVLMRFNSPDSWSPFGEGGLNAYGYCGGDPVNRDDQTGHMFKLPTIPILKGSSVKKAVIQNKSLSPIAEAPKLSPQTTSQSAQSVEAKTMRNATKSSETKGSAAVTLSKVDEASFRNALDHAIERGQSIDLNPVSTPPSFPTQPPRPVRKRNTVVLGGGKDFLPLKIGEARSSTMSSPTTEIRES